jgi:hypothetical protein
MSACSLNIKPIEESDTPAMLLPGQKYATVTKSELLEISLVTVPGQKNAVKLSNNNELRLTLEGSEYNLKEIKNENSKTMDEEKSKVEELNKQLSIERERNASNLIKLHQKRGVVSDGEVEHLRKLAAADYESVEKMLDARPEPKPEEPKKEESSKTDETQKRGQESKELSAKLEGFGKEIGTKPANAREGWDYYKWFKEDPDGLRLMAQNEPEKFKKLEMDFAQESKSLNLKANAE